MPVRIEVVTAQKVPGGMIIVPSRLSTREPMATAVVMAPVAMLNDAARPHANAVVRVAAEPARATDEPWPGRPQMHDPRVAVIAVIADTGAAVVTPEPALGIQQ